MKMFKLMMLMTLGLPVLSVSETSDPILKLARCPIRAYAQWYRVGPYCARHFRQLYTFGDAERYCSRQHRDGHLISVHNRRTNDDLEMLTGCGHIKAWIGGYKMPCNNHFMWTDGSKWNYQNWVPGEPNGNGDCVQLNWHTPGMFDDAGCCNNNKTFVCAFPIKYTAM